MFGGRGRKVRLKNRVRGTLRSTHPLFHFFKLPRTDAHIASVPDQEGFAKTKGSSLPAHGMRGAPKNRLISIKSGPLPFCQVYRTGLLTLQLAVCAFADVASAANRPTIAAPVRSSLG